MVSAFPCGRKAKERKIQAACSEGDIRSAGKSPRPVWERIRGALAATPTNKEPKAIHLRQAESRTPFPNRAIKGDFPERRVACFLLLFPEKVEPVPRRYEKHAARAPAQKRTAAFHELFCQGCFHFFLATSTNFV